MDADSNDHYDDFSLAPPDPRRPYGRSGSQTRNSRKSLVTIVTINYLKNDTPIALELVVGKFNAKWGDMAFSLLSIGEFSCPR